MDRGAWWAIVRGDREESALQPGEESMGFIVVCRVPTVILLLPSLDSLDAILSFLKFQFSFFKSVK